MNEELLMLFAEYLEKQDALSKLTEHERLHSWGYSEIHTVAAIGDLEEPNVTAIAEHMHMTKGAVSKIIKKLTKEELVEAYKKPGNNQKIYYSLREKGRFLYDEHEKRHRMWKKRDDDFFRQFTAAELEEIRTFMEKFNLYLGEQIDLLSGKKAQREESSAGRKLSGKKDEERQL
ncbi:MAG: MarR family winged helix-turn-helix transcriptional regulator [Emergencia sp.]